VLVLVAGGSYHLCSHVNGQHRRSHTSLTKARFGGYFSERDALNLYLGLASTVPQSFLQKELLADHIQQPFAYGFIVQVMYVLRMTQSHVYKARMETSKLSQSPLHQDPGSGIWSHEDPKL